MSEDKDAKAKAAPSRGLKKMKKDGETIAVHKSCVAAHERRGWKIAK